MTEKSREKSVSVLPVSGRNLNLDLPNTKQRRCPLEDGFLWRQVVT
jgi:hypothetical protein